MGDLGGRSYPPDGQITPDEKQMGMLAHLLGIIGFIGPLVIWLIKKDQSAYVAKQGIHALYFHIALAISWFIAAVIAAITCGIGGILFLPIFVIHIMYVVVATMKANEGLIYEYPVTSKFVK